METAVLKKRNSYSYTDLLHFFYYLTLTCIKFDFFYNIVLAVFGLKGGIIESSSNFELFAGIIEVLCNVGIVSIDFSLGFSFDLSFDFFFGGSVSNEGKL